MYGPEDGEVKIPKGVVHSLKAYKGVECVVDERTDPMVGFPFDRHPRLMTQTCRAGW